jgi:hypothetical protein
MEPLTQGEARALLCAKELLDSGELPGPVYDTLAGWVTRKLGIMDLPNILRTAGSPVFLSENDDSGDETSELGDKTEPSKTTRLVHRTEACRPD